MRRVWTTASVVLPLLLMAAQPAHASPSPVFGTTLVRYTFSTVAGPGRPVIYTYGVSLSEDGRFAAFEGGGPHWQGPTPLSNGIYVRDRATRTTLSATAGFDGSPADGASVRPVLSANGRYLTFWSEATNLVPADTNDRPDVFVRDLQAGTTKRVSVGPGGRQADRGSFESSISADGRYVVFRSEATNLVPGTPDGGCLLRDVVAGVTELVYAGFCDVDAQSVSDDGTQVAFRAVPPGEDRVTFVRDRRLGRTVRVSDRPDGRPADGGSTDYALAGNGAAIAFTSNASDLVPGDTNGFDDVFVHDLGSGRTSRVSLSSTDGQLTSAGHAAISRDARRVAWQSFSVAVPGDTNGVADVFVRDRQAGTTRIASVGGSGQSDTRGSEVPPPAISADGLHVAFVTSSALVPGDRNMRNDAFIRE